MFVHELLVPALYQCMTLSLSISIKKGICYCYIYHLSEMITVLTRFLNVSAFKTYSKVIRCYRGQEPTTDFKQIATVTSTTAVVDAKSWGEYVTVACQTPAKLQL